MLILLVAFLGGVLTVLSPCVLPVLPFVFARSGRPFRSHALPLLASMALAFAGIATLAAVGGAWVVALNDHARYAALTLLALFGLALLIPRVAQGLTRPFVALGARLSSQADDQGTRGLLAPIALGLGAGLLWAPCAGPVLGLILTSAALNGANVGTSLLLLVYAVGACTALAAALWSGQRLAFAMRRMLPAAGQLRRLGGAAVLVAVASIAFGVDTQVLARITLPGTTQLEQALVDRIRPAATPRPQEDVRGQPAAPRLLTVAPQAEAPGAAPLLAGAGEWINSPALGAQDLRGKVVLVNFWTYSCINCLRTLPYLRAWADRYRDAGLVVIGVHTPEFAFEKRSANVRRAAADLGIRYPVATDNHFAVWRAFRNQAWPAFYVFDATGRLRHHEAGEHDYARSEAVLRKLLAEAGRAPAAGAPVRPEGQGTQAAAASTAPRSYEAYLGYDKGNAPAGTPRVARDRDTLYAAPPGLDTNEWSLAGHWRVEAERVVLARANGRIAHRFHARDLHLVLGPSPDGRPVRFRVLLDGVPPGADHGADTNAQGEGVIDGQRLYQLVRQRSSKARTFEIEFLDPGAEAYAFTFG